MPLPGALGLCLRATDNPAYTSCSDRVQKSLQGGQELTIPAVSLVAEERTLRGSYLGSGVPALDVPRYIDAYKAGRLPVDRLLSHRISLDALNEGFDRLASGEAVRQAVIF